MPAPGRSRVLSAFGRDDTAERWYEGDHGPRTPLSEAAPANCVSCGFFVPLSGGLGLLFGACGNAYAPDDGRVVSADHGCGAHSEAVLTGAAAQAATPMIDELGYDLVDLPGVSVEETVFEPLSRKTYPESGGRPHRGVRDRGGSRTGRSRPRRPGRGPPTCGEPGRSEAAGGRRARWRLRKGTYQSPNRPIARPKAHVHTHQRCADRQRVAESEHDRERDRPADRDHGGNLAIVRLLGRRRRASASPGSALPISGSHHKANWLLGSRSRPCAGPLGLAPSGSETWCTWWMPRRVRKRMRVWRPRCGFRSPDWRGGSAWSGWVSAGPRPSCPTSSWPRSRPSSGTTR